MRIIYLVIIGFTIVLVQNAICGSLSESDSLDKTLDHISSLGSLLYKYDLAVRIATDTVLAHQPEQEKVRYYVASLDNSIWRIGFGRLSATRNEFLLAYEVGLTESLNFVRYEAYEPVQRDTTIYFSLAKAVNIALRVNDKIDQPYNYAALPQSDGTIAIFYYPAQTSSDVYPLGADIKYTISPSQDSVLERKQLHKSILQFKLKSNEGSLSLSYHKAVITDVPVETDVLFVLLRGKPVSHQVWTDKWVFIINPEGYINRIDRKAYENMK